MESAVSLQNVVKRCKRGRALQERNRQMRTIDPKAAAYVERHVDANKGQLIESVGSP